MEQALQQYKAEHPELEGADLILSLLKDINREKEGQHGKKHQGRKS